MFVMLFIKWAVWRQSKENGSKVFC